ncbi:MAG: PA4642 family protein [Pseudomonadales bacterium]
MRPDKEKVVDEVWDDDRIESFLHKSPMGEERSRDYSVLLNAYRSMRPGDFERFLARFVALGRDVDARSNAGQTLLATIADHRHGAPFRELLLRHGAAA